MRRPYAIALFGMALLVALGIVASCKEGKGPAQAETSYANLRPEVQYTGRASCQPCHKEIYDSYLQTGMGRSLYRPEQKQAIEDFGADAVVWDGHSGYGYRPFWRGDDLMILEFRLEGKDTSYRREEKIDYIVGSGHQTRSYLLERQGYFYEAPITWYVSRGKWDLSPGYENGQNTRFDRTIGEECMGCHTGKVDFVPGTMNHFRQISLGIDCEKCHGPGQEHIARMERDEIVDVGEQIDYSIVNPAKLPIDLQIDVCTQCHLQGVNVLKAGHNSVLEFRPGMSLSAVYDVFVEQHTGEADFGIASHAERMMESRCFFQSDGKLTCTTCHDPHRSIAVTGADTYVRACQSCHTGAASMPACSAPADLRSTRADDCAGCHMRKAGTSDIPHVTFTDHKIRVLRDTATASTGAIRAFLRLVCMTDSQPEPRWLGRAYLQYYEQHLAEANVLQEAERNIAPDDAAALGRLAYLKGNPAQALVHLEAALQQRPDDLRLLFQKADALELTGKLTEAKALFGRIFQQQPALVEAGLRQGVLALKLAQDPNAALQEARGIFEKCRTQKPFDHKVCANLGFVEMNMGQHEAAEKRFLQALSTHPDYALALENMVLLQMQMGRKEAAKIYLKQLARFHPDAPSLPNLRQQLGKQ